MTEPRPAEGAPAPLVALPDQDDTIHRLADYRGRWLLLYFYPKDDTPGCTKEACGLRDRFDDFERAGVAVLGVSPDPVRRHRAFAAKYGLPFPLLADEERTVVNAYGVWGPKKFMGRTFDGVHRRSFLIAPDGTVAKVYQKVKPASHAAEVLEDMTRPNDALVAPPQGHG